jgi:hypothetical protein
MRHSRNHVGHNAVQGDSSISITQKAAGRRSETASSAPPTVTAGVLSGLVLLVVGVGIAAAAPAAAVDDPTRPDARVTHGPSCRPGGLVVEVQGGTSPYSVRLSTTRSPGGEDEATVAPGTTVSLRSADVAWGETIDGRLEYTALDGTGDTFVDELEHYSFTRPTQEDCAAVNDPTEPHPSPPSSPGAPDSQGESGGTSSPPNGTPPAQTPTPSEDTEAGAVPTLPGSGPAARVAPGDTVTVGGAGFLPGERVVVRLAGGTVLGAVTAAADGTVQAQVRIPERTATGATTVNLLGDDSAVSADIDLRVAARTTSTGEDDVAALLPLVAAAGALVATTTGLVSVAGRGRASAVRRRPLRGSA